MDDKLTEEMILIPEGEFLMGSTEEEIELALQRLKEERHKYNDLKVEKPHRKNAQNELPQRLIYLDAFYIDKYPVSNALYRIFLEETKYPWRPASLDHPVLGRNNHPVVSVSYKDALAYCEWAGKDLPSEAQWEKAARGVDSRLYTWGNTPPDEDGEFKANYAPGNNRKVDGYEYTCSVDAFMNNISPYGVIGMTGNIWEWTKDWYHDDWYREGGELRNPKGPEYGLEKVVRGGSFLNLGFCLRCADRHHFDPLHTGEGIGFRCVLNVKPEVLC